MKSNAMRSCEYGLSPVFLDGYGFIVPDEPGANDVFVHVSAIASGFSALAANQRVEYEVGVDPRTSVRRRSSARRLTRLSRHARRCVTSATMPSRATS